MAENNDAHTGSSAAPSKISSENPKTPENNGHATEQEDGDQAGDIVFKLNVNLPHEPKQIELMVSSQEAIHDIRQSIIELPGTFQYSCFHLEHKGKRINDFAQLSEVEGITTDSELTLVEDPYTEKDARLHVVRVRELIGAAGDRTDTLHGILSGLSLHDSIFADFLQNSPEAPTFNPIAEYDFHAPGVLSTLIPQTQNPAPKTVKSISVSPWNPPPYHLRQKGHLMYLLLTTNEGEQYQITSHVSGFYVSKSTNIKFDPFPRGAPKAHSAHSLLNLINDISASFDSSFQKLQEYNNSKEPLASFQITNATPSSPWVVPSSSSPLTTHQADLTRTQESYLISGLENSETLRDWNEEFQSTRELPKDSVQDRVFRERLTSKLFADYNEAAARGAVLVARGEVAPLNPTEGRDAQIFVYNNVFFSFGADGVGTFASEGGDEAARVATGKDVLGVRMVNQLDIDGLFTPGTIVVDYLGKRIVGQSIVPGIFKQREPGENQIDYGAVDGKEVIASDERFVPVFKKLSEALKVKKHTVWDKSNKSHELEGSVETKGLLGTDGRKYALDLYRITPLDISWMEEFGTAIGSSEDLNGASKSSYPHRMTVLRPELVDAFWKFKMREWVNNELQKRRTTESDTGVKKEITEGQNAESKVSKPEEDSSEALQANIEKEKIDITNFSFALNPDAFSGQEPQSDADKESLTKDEQDVRSACEYLRKTAIPELVNDLKEGEVGFPMDGQSLSKLLHKRGINIRYLGKVATLCEGQRLESLRILAVQEMIARAFKHVSAKYLRYLPIPLTASCVAHLLNCLLGAGLNSKPKADVDESMVTLYPEADLDFQKVTPKSLREEIEDQILRRYQYTVDKEWVSNIKQLQLLREISLKLGLQIELKDYQFNALQSNGADNSSATNGTAKENGVNGQSAPSKKKKKATRDGSPASVASTTSAPHTFHPEDILNIVPVIKEASPRSSLAEEALEAGRISILQNQKKLGQELLLESLSLHEQIYGIIHPEVARVYNTLSMIYYQLEEKEAAVELARKAVIVAERTLGVDNAETLLSYLNLGLFSHAAGETKLALQYIHHALNLWNIIYGPAHPDSITTLNNAAVMLQHLKFYHSSRLWFESSLSICSSIYGSDSINAATLLFQLAQALALDQDSKAAVNKMKESYSIFLKELGPNDKNTKEAESWLTQLTQNAVSIAKHAKDNQARRIRAGIVPQTNIGQTLAARDASAGAAGRVGEGKKALDQRSIDELLRFIEGTDAKGKTTPKKRPAGRGNPKRRGGAGGIVS